MTRSIASLLTGSPICRTSGASSSLGSRRSVASSVRTSLAQRASAESEPPKPGLARNDRRVRVSPYQNVDGHFRNDLSIFGRTAATFEWTSNLQPFNHSNYSRYNTGNRNDANLASLRTWRRTRADRGWRRSQLLTGRMGLTCRRSSRPQYETVLVAGNGPPVPVLFLANPIELSICAT